jgi:hypothetical protein
MAVTHNRPSTAEMVCGAQWGLITTGTYRYTVNTYIYSILQQNVGIWPYSILVYILSSTGIALPSFANNTLSTRVVDPDLIRIQ